MSVVGPSDTTIAPTESTDATQLDFDQRLAIIRSNGVDGDILARVAESRLEGFKLSRSGKAKACCPFHAEDTPSLVLSSSGRYKCFGGSCGASGDTIDLVTHTDELGFRDAVDRISFEIGLIDADGIANADLIARNAGFVRSFAPRNWTPIPTTRLPLAHTAMGRAGQVAVNRWKPARSTFHSAEIRTIANPDRGYHVTKIQALYPYQDDLGQLVGVVVRYPDPTNRTKKTTAFLTYGQLSNGWIGWISDARSGADGHLFNLPAMRDAMDPKGLVIIVSGEKDCLCGADLLQAHDLPVITFAGGDAQVEKPDWSAAIDFCRDLDVPAFIVADNDLSGYKAASKLTSKLRAAGVVCRQPDAKTTFIIDTATGVTKLSPKLGDMMGDLLDAGVNAAPVGWKTVSVEAKDNLSDLAAKGVAGDAMAEWILASPVVTDDGYLPLSGTEIQMQEAIESNGATLKSYAAIRGLSPNLLPRMSLLGSVSDPAVVEAAKAMHWRQPQPVMDPKDASAQRMDLYRAFCSTSLGYQTVPNLAVQTPPALVDLSPAGGGKTTAMLLAIAEIIDDLFGAGPGLEADGIDRHRHVIVASATNVLSNQTYRNALKTLDDQGCVGAKAVEVVSRTSIIRDAEGKPIFDNDTEEELRHCPRYKELAALTPDSDNTEEAFNDADGDRNNGANIARASSRLCKVRQRNPETREMEDILCPHLAANTCPYHQRKEAAIAAAVAGPCVFFMSHKRGCNIPLPRYVGQPALVVLDENFSNGSTISISLPVAQLGYPSLTAADIPTSMYVDDDADDEDPATNFEAVHLAADWNDTWSTIKISLNTIPDAELPRWTITMLARQLAPVLAAAERRDHPETTSPDIDAYAANDRLSRLIAICRKKQDTSTQGINPHCGDRELAAIARLYRQWLDDYGHRCMFLEMLRAEIIRLHESGLQHDVRCRLIDEPARRETKTRPARPAGRAICMSQLHPLQDKILNAPVLVIDATNTLTEMHDVLPNHQWQARCFNARVNAKLYLMPENSCAASGVVVNEESLEGLSRLSNEGRKAFRQALNRRQLSEKLALEAAAMVGHFGWGKVAHFSAKRVQAHIKPLIRRALITHGLVGTRLTDAAAEIAAQDSHGNAKSYNEIFAKELAAVQAVMDGDDSNSRYNAILDGAIKFGHFGALRGLNDYMDCVGYMIVGRLELPINALEQQIVARRGVGVDPNAIRISRQADGMGDFDTVTAAYQIGGDLWTRQVRSFNASAARDRLIATTVAELKQAMGRARAIHGDVTKHIFLRSAVPDLDVAYDDMLSHDGFMARFAPDLISSESSPMFTIADRIKANGGVMPWGACLLTSMINAGDHAFPGGTSGGSTAVAVKTISDWQAHQGFPAATAQAMAAQGGIIEIEGKLDGQYSIRRVTWAGKKAGGDSLILVRDDIADAAAIKASLDHWGLPADATAELACTLIEAAPVEVEPASLEEQVATASANDNHAEAVEPVEPKVKEPKKPQDKKPKQPKVQVASPQVEMVLTMPDGLAEFCRDGGMGCQGSSCEWFNACPYAEGRMDAA
jgi:hypothetical protein